MKPEIPHGGQGNNPMKALKTVALQRGACNARKMLNTTTAHLWCTLSLVGGERGASMVNEAEWRQERQVERIGSWKEDLGALHARISSRFKRKEAGLVETPPL